MKRGMVFQPVSLSEGDVSYIHIRPSEEGVASVPINSSKGGVASLPVSPSKWVKPLFLSVKLNKAWSVFCSPIEGGMAYLDR